MNKRDKMYQEIERHGIDLMRIFQVRGVDPVALAKRVHRVETKARRLATDYCNGLIETDDWEKHTEVVLTSLDKILGFVKLGIPVHVNGDARGYALKIDDAYVRDHQLQIYRDWGGYGILAPDFDGK